jgi:predicted transcriptional regulator of viral defense system
MRCMAVSEREQRREWRLSRAQPDSSATHRDVEVARVAGEQSGIIATRQLKACGVDRDAIRVRVARGQLHPVFHGVYAVGHGALTQAALFTAAVLACGAQASLSHHAAAAHHGLLRWDDRAVEVIVPRSAGRKIDAIRPHRATLDSRDVWIRDTIRVTSPARTILDIAAAQPFKPLRRMVRQALAEQKVSVRQLLDVLRRHLRHRGAAGLRAVIADAPAPTRSDLEDLALDLLDTAGIDRPEVNPTLRLAGRDIRPDLLFAGQRLVIELDGRRWHADPLTQRDDADKQAILEAHGYRVLRITWWQLVDHPRQTLRRIRAALGDP